MFFGDTFGDNEPGSLSYQEVERMMLNSKVLEPLYEAIPKSEKDEIHYYFDQDWARRNVDLKSEILKTFEGNKDKIYEAASRYRLNIRRIRNVLSELTGILAFSPNRIGTRPSRKEMYNLESLE